MKGAQETDRQRQNPSIWRRSGASADDRAAGGRAAEAEGGGEGGLSRAGGEVAVPKAKAILIRRPPGSPWNCSASGYLSRLRRCVGRWRGACSVAGAGCGELRSCRGEAGRGRQGADRRRAGARSPAARAAAALLVALAHDAVFRRRPGGGQEHLRRGWPHCSTWSRSARSPDVGGHVVHADPRRNGMATARSDTKKAITARAAASFDPVATEAARADRGVSLPDLPGVELRLAEPSRSERPELTAARVAIPAAVACRRRGTLSLWSRLPNSLGPRWVRTCRGGCGMFRAQRLPGGANGKIVAPELCIAVGMWRDPVSCWYEGTEGHRGDQEGRGKAPIFQVADYGLVADPSRRRRAGGGTGGSE